MKRLSLTNCKGERVAVPLRPGIIKKSYPYSVISGGFPQWDQNQYRNRNRESAKHLLVRSELFYFI
jgi:hypothetical protein